MKWMQIIIKYWLMKTTKGLIIYILINFGKLVMKANKVYAN